MYERKAQFYYTVERCYRVRLSHIPVTDSPTIRYIVLMLFNKSMHCLPNSRLSIERKLNECNEKSEKPKFRVRESKLYILVNSLNYLSLS